MPLFDFTNILHCMYSDLQEHEHRAVCPHCDVPIRSTDPGQPDFHQGACPSLKSPIIRPEDNTFNLLRQVPPPRNFSQGFPDTLDGHQVQINASRGVNGSQVLYRFSM